MHTAYINKTKEPHQVGAAVVNYYISLITPIN